MYNRQKVLIVDAGHEPALPVYENLSGDGYDICKSPDVETAIDIIQRDNIAAIITDERMLCRDGTQFFKFVTENHPEIPVIFKTACGTEEHGYSTGTHKAFCHSGKHPDYVYLKSILDSAIEQRFLKSEFESLKKSLMDENIRYRISGNTVAMRKIFEVIEAVKDSDCNVIIYGEPGTGKELIARAITSLGKTQVPFIAVNCSAMPKEIIESELFGCEMEVSGTSSKNTAKFDEVQKVTIFLDEIGDIELSLQEKLLRVIRKKEVQHPGNNGNGNGGIRFISSTKRDLKKEVQKGNFREDLFRRINQTEIVVPPLRERKNDIPLLVSEFVNEFCLREKKTAVFSDRVIKIFLDYSWPGNVRQLRNVVRRSIALCKGNMITHRELPDEFCALKNQSAIHNSIRTIRDLEKDAIQDALHGCNGNKSKAARMLGISRKAFYRRLSECCPE